MIWTIAITFVVTVLLVVLAMNFATPEKKIERKIEHRYAIADPQFRREMGVLLACRRDASYFRASWPTM